MSASPKSFSSTSSLSSKSVLSKAVSPVTERHDLLIHGKRVPSASGRYFDTLNPATEEVKIGRAHV